MTDSIIRAVLTGRRAVIFDWDGTLADTQDRNYQALNAALAPHHVTIDLARHARAAGLRCAVASGAAGALVEAGLDILKLRALFHVVVTREDVAHGKPAPDAFLEATRRLDVAPQHCLAVEDTPDGITTAQQAGMCVLLIRNGQLTRPADTDIPTHGARATRT